VASDQSCGKLRWYNCWLLARTGGFLVNLTQVKGPPMFIFNLAFALARHGDRRLTDRASFIFLN